jgi:hypothetical protein
MIQVVDNPLCGEVNFIVTRDKTIIFTDSLNIGPEDDYGKQQASFTDCR